MNNILNWRAGIQAFMHEGVKHATRESTPTKAHRSCLTKIITHNIHTAIPIPIIVGIGRVASHRKALAQLRFW